MGIDQLKEIISKYNAGESTAEEKIFLEQWYASFQWDTATSNESDQELQQLQENIWQTLKDANSIEGSKIQGANAIIRTLSVNHYQRKWKYAAAAIIILLGAAAIYKLAIFNQSTPKSTAVNIVKPANVTDIAAGGNKAILTLADGSTIVLDSAQNGNLVSQGNTRIIKQDGKLAYNSLENSTAFLYNTIATPRGGEYQLVLADGTKVWLNAASSLHFPTTFSGNERIVQLTGEAYFEVAKNAAKPFKVEMNNGMAIEVLGTHFNVMGYDDELSIKTTLVEGKVKVMQGTNSIMLMPNQQAKLTKAGNTILVDKNADINKAIAWKNGIFDFDDDGITDIMRQISRWYDVDIDYSLPVLQPHFTGSIRREVNVLQVLHMLELAGGVNFTIVGNKIIVKTK
jgi:ferric-dicitrate binding protein FerR (iron transport regulator)